MMCTIVLKVQLRVYSFLTVAYVAFGFLWQYWIMLCFVTLLTVEGWPLQGRDSLFGHEGRSWMVNRTVDSGVWVRQEISQLEMLARCMPLIMEHLWGDNSFLEAFFFFRMRALALLRPSGVCGIVERMGVTVGRRVASWANSRTLLSGYCR